MHPTKVVAVLLVILSLSAACLPFALALPPLENNVVFPAGAFVIPMDSRQAERILVFGFVHALLRAPSPITIFRVIEPPSVTLPTNLTASPASFEGGPFLVSPADASKVQQIKSRPEFRKVTVGTLSSQQTLNNIFRITEPTRILVVKGLWGRTDLTLDAMRIPYNITSKEDLAANPSMIFSYSLIVVDCYGWAGSIPPDVSNNLKTHVNAGNEVIYTDIAFKDMNVTFPGYVNLWGPQPQARIASAYQYVPARKYDPTKYGAPADRFPAEFPSQYFNPPPRSNEIKVFTETAGYVVSSIPSGKVNDVRIIADSKSYGPAGNQYAILGFYFEYGAGIVEGLAFHPQQQVKSVVGNHGYYAVYQVYGNKFVHPPLVADFTLTATPPSRTVPAGASTTYLATIQSFGTFSSPVGLSVTGLPAGATANFNPPAPTPPQNQNVNSTLTVTTSLTTPAGTYTLNVTGSALIPGGPTKWTLVELNVEAPLPDFTISVSPSALTINVTESKSANVTVTSIGSFNNNVTLELLGLPPHVTVTFDPPAPKPPPLGGKAYSIMRINVGGDAVNGTYPLTITGTSGALAHSIPFTLTITKPPVAPIPWWILLILLTMYVVPTGGQRVRCLRCGRPVEINAVYCPFCGQRRGGMAVAGIAAVPAQAVPVRPLPVRRAAFRGRRAVWGFVLAVASAVLILLNSVALLSAGFWGPPTNWSLIFWWLGGPAGLGQSIATLIGVLSGFIVMTGGIMMVLRRGVLGAALTLPFAIISIIMGGGFIIGMVLGIVSGILGALGR